MIHAEYLKLPPKLLVLMLECKIGQLKKCCYTGWKGNKCHPFNSRRGQLKEPKNMYTIWGLNLIVSSEEGVSFSLLSTSYTVCTIRDNAKTFTLVMLSYKDLMLFPKNIRVRCSLRKIK